jgi:hypothetical protein
LLIVGCFADPDAIAVPERCHVQPLKDAGKDAAGRWVDAVAIQTRG